jgi:branched-chain amino acid transport system ATP-binding protein
MIARLELRDVSLAFGGVKVSQNVSLSLEHGARTALIGPNGAGKTTLVNLISGRLSPSNGDILLDGTSMRPHNEMRRVHAGIVRTFQISRFFRPLSVEDNLRLAIIQREKLGEVFLRSICSFDDMDQEVEQLLATLNLSAHRKAISGSLAYGEQRLLEILLALAMRPRVLLLDEPAAGVPQAEVGLVLDTIAQLPSDLAILLIEHDMDVVFRFARHVVVLVDGKVFAEGAPSDIAASASVREVYFGRSHHGRNRH